MEVARMTSRERVLTAIQHREPDKVPIDCGGTICSTLTRNAHNAVKGSLGIHTPDEAVTHPVLDTVVPCEELLRRWEVDCRAVRMRPPAGISDSSTETQGFAATSAAVIIQPRGHTFCDEFGTTWQKADFDYAPVRHAFRDFDLSDLEHFTWPDPYDSGRVSGLKDEARTLQEVTDYCIVADIMCGGPFEQACWLRGYSEFLTDLYADPAFARALLDRITELDIGFWDAYLRAVGEHVQVVAQGDDVGTQDREYISPELYRQFVFPCHKRMYDFIHSRTRAKIFMHSCGSIRKLIPFLIEAGVDALNPVQYSAANMHLAELKREFGSEIAFWGGGIDTQHALLGKGVSPASVEESTKRNMAVLMKGGGFVFAATHNIQHEVPPEITLLVYDTAVKNRDYHVKQ
jgi:uroporphyrinogen decarboxylase